MFQDEGILEFEKYKRVTLIEFLIFREMGISCSKFKNNYFISGGNFQVTSLKKCLIFIKKICSSHFSYCF